MVADLHPRAAQQRRIDVELGLDLLVVALLEGRHDVVALLVVERLGAGDAGAHDLVVLTHELVELLGDGADERLAVVVHEDADQVLRDFLEARAGHGVEELLLLRGRDLRVRHGRARLRIGGDGGEHLERVVHGAQGVLVERRLEGGLGVGTRDGGELGHF